MAEGFLRSIYPEAYDSYSAGIEQTQVQPLAQQVMKEIGIDISHQYSKTIEDYSDRSFDVVVTVCDHAKEMCPFFPGKKIIHQSFPDPSTVQGTEEERLHAFRTVRDRIQTWVRHTFQNPEGIEEISNEV